MGPSLNFYPNNTWPGGTSNGEAQDEENVLRYDIFAINQFY